METTTATHDLQLPPADAAWAAVEARDAGMDGRFVYAVTSTGIYCRPSCPSRRPRRDRVAFFAAPEGAEAAGFRACRRCRPRSAGPSEAARTVRLVREYLDAHLDETVTLEELGREVGLSPWHLQRTFKQQTGMSPKNYVQARRAERLKARLQEGETVTTATYEAGYGASSRLYEQAGRRLGMTPGTYRRGGAGLDIRYAVVASPLGRLLVAATPRGVCAVTMGDDDRTLEAALRDEYPKARLDRIEGEGDDFAAWVEAVVASLDGAPLTLPLDLQGTAFQQRVWRALQEIPRGETRTYSEVAAGLGQPTAARAVAQACASNRVALAIPCHRVVRSDGDSGGYRWGAGRKRQILARESGGPVGQ
jgi:AraC family transcriptional regulator of adaptative response/methylated-DNA-[protein]-cysteine methyltransferase